MINRISNIGTANNYDRKRRENFKREQDKFSIAQANLLSNPNRIDVICVQSTDTNTQLDFTVVKRRHIDRLV